MVVLPNVLTVERLRALVLYDLETGVFTRRVSRRGRAMAGATFGTLNGKGYLVGMLDGKLYLLHRLAWFYVHGTWPACEIDHTDCDKGNNRLLNLREATRTQNEGNKSLKSSNTTGFKGVTWSTHANKYRASIKVNGKTKNLGYRPSPEEASVLYAEAANKHFGAFTRM